MNPAYYCSHVHFFVRYLRTRKLLGHFLSDMIISKKSIYEHVEVRYNVSIFSDLSMDILYIYTSYRFFSIWLNTEFRHIVICFFDLIFGISDFVVSRRSIHVIETTKFERHRLESFDLSRKYRFSIYLHQNILPFVERSLLLRYYSKRLLW